MSAHLDRRLGAASLLLILVLAAACTNGSAGQKGGTFDYGTCPTNAEALMKSRFKSGLMVTYAGEPVVWRADRLWWQDPPQAGGRFYAGHLVVVLAHQTFGRPDYQGKKLYAFILHNDKVVKEFGPNAINRIPIKENVGPMPFDERTWQVGASKEDETRLLTQHVLQGEKLESATELVTLQQISRVPEDATLDGLLQESEQAVGCKLVDRRPIASGPSEVVVEQAFMKCPDGRDRFAIRKLIRGPRSVSDVSYARTTPFTDADRQKWTELVRRASWGRPCVETPS